MHLAGCPRSAAAAKPCRRHDAEVLAVDPDGPMGLSVSRWLGGAAAPSLERLVVHHHVGWSTASGEPGGRRARPQSERGADSMSVMVQYIVKVSDVDRFVTTSEKFAPMMEEWADGTAASTRTRTTPALSQRSPSGRATTRCTRRSRSTTTSSTRRPGRLTYGGPPTSGIGGEAPDRSHSRTASVNPPRRGLESARRPLQHLPSPSPQCSSPRHPSWSGSPPWD